MSGDTAPSWLTDDAAVDAGAKLAKNPAVQKAAVKAAKDPRVQKAATDAAMRKLNNDPTWASGDDESASADDVEANVGPQVCDSNDVICECSSLVEQRIVFEFVHLFL